MTKKILIAIAGWVWRRYGIHGVDPYLLEAARNLVTAANEKFPDTSGEYKRHQVYAVLQRKFPSTLHRKLSRAIEEALP